jgi:LssY C-terminus
MSPFSKSPSIPLHRRRWFQIGLLLLAASPGIYWLLAYVALPILWRHYEHNPKLEHSPKATQTAQGIPGDPLNVGLVGTHDEVVKAFLIAGWFPADPITLHSSAGIAKSVLLKHSYPTAPVSSLFFQGRKQDLAFELPVGSSAKQRHHVRLWQSNDLSNESRPFWIGSATFDSRVGISHYTGQITHHIDADIDQERDILTQTLEQVHLMTGLYRVTGVGATLEGHNGGGDRYFTDGELTVNVLSANSATQLTDPDQKPNLVQVEVKDRIWSWLRPPLRQRLAD